MKVVGVARAQFTSEENSFSTIYGLFTLHLPIGLSFYGTLLSLRLFAHLRSFVVFVVLLCFLKTMNHLQDRPFASHSSYEECAFANYPDRDMQCAILPQDRSEVVLLVENQQLHQDLELLQVNFHCTMEEHSHFIH